MRGVCHVSKVIMLHHEPDPQRSNCLILYASVWFIHAHFLSLFYVFDNCMKFYRPITFNHVCLFFFQWDAVKIRTRRTRGDKMRLTTKTCWESIILSMFSLSSGMFPEKWTRKPELFGSLKKKKKADPNAKTVEVFLEACAMCYYFHVKVLDH